jgi:hypothetical protein
MGLSPIGKEVEEVLKENNPVRYGSQPKAERKGDKQYNAGRPVTDFAIGGA